MEAAYLPIPIKGIHHSSFRYLCLRFYYGRVRAGLSPIIYSLHVDALLKGCRNCWSYKVLKFAFEANITKFNPGNAYFSKQMLDAIC